MKNTDRIFLIIVILACQLLFPFESCKAAGVIPAGEESPEASVPLLRFTASFAETPDLRDYSVIYLSENATVEFDSKLDALKLMNTDSQVPNIFTITPGGTKLSINALPPLNDYICKVQLGIVTERDGFVIVRIKDIDDALLRYRLFIYDMDEGTEHDLLPGNVFSVFLPRGEYKSRFVMCFSDLATDVRDIDHNDELLKVWQSAGILKLNIATIPGSSGMVSIFDSSGREILRKKVFHPGEYELYPGQVNGIYFVTLTSANLRLARKIYLTGR